MADIFQYSPTLNVKIKIFKVYIAPIIEYFLPSIIRANVNQSNRMERFQHEILCKALEIPRTANMKKTLQVLKIKSIAEKLETACLRYRTYLDREPSKPTETRTTRSGRRLDINHSAKNFADRICMIAENGETREKPTRNTKFSVAYAALWASHQRQNIQAKVAASAQQ